FRELFRGREDVFPRRWSNPRTGKSGYSPVCGNEWAPGLCDKPKVKCGDCPNRRFLPVTDDAIRHHLRGEGADGRDFTMGVYPLLATASSIDMRRDCLMGSEAGVAFGLQW
ncbi:MAG: hypothetical protein H7841_17015, partial [Magnetospirillum sp. WYHS-4]